MLKISSAFALLALCLYSCVHDPVLPENGGNSGGNGGGGSGGGGGIEDPCDPDSVYFANDILPLLNSNCAIPGCHNAASAQDGVILDSYANVLATTDVDPSDPVDSDIYEVITDSDLDDRMPPAFAGFDALEAQEIQLILDWISQGALDNSCDQLCDSTDISFSAHIFPIFSDNCIGCHSGSTPQAGLSLSNYAEISATALRSDDPIINSLLGNAPFSLMPFGQDPLEDCQINMIQLWINDGAPNN